MNCLVMEPTWKRHPVNTLRYGKPIDVRWQFIGVLR